jgi:hypothetical protein
VSPTDKVIREIQKLSLQLDVITAGTHWRDNDMSHVAKDLSVCERRVYSIIQMIEGMQQDADTQWRTAITFTEYMRTALDRVHAWTTPLTLARTNNAEPCDEWFEQAGTINDMWCSKLLNDDATVPSLELVRKVRQRNLQHFGEQYEFCHCSDDFEGCFDSFELRVGITEKPRYKSSSSDDGSSDEIGR